MLATFDAIGVDGGMAEHGYREADIHGEWRGSDVLVEASPINYPRLRFRPLRTMEIAGVAIAFGRMQTWGRAYGFTCRRTVYRVTPLSGTIDVVPSFLEQLVPLLPCPEA